MIKKRYLVMLTGLIVIGLSISIYQYAQTLKTEFASAADTKPINGHSWAEMESDDDSIKVINETTPTPKRIITNLTSPSAPTDVANKEYVDTVSGGGIYSVCYGAVATSCATGFTLIASNASGVYSYGSEGVCAGVPTPKAGTVWTYPCVFSMGNLLLAPAFNGTGGTNSYIGYSVNNSGVTYLPVGTGGVFCCK